MVLTAERSGIDRSELARTVNGWEMEGEQFSPLAVPRSSWRNIGYINSKASQVRAVSAVPVPDFCLVLTWDTAIHDHETHAEGNERD